MCYGTTMKYLPRTTPARRSPKFTLVLEPERFLQLRSVAHAKGVSMNRFIEGALIKALAQEADNHAEK